MPANFNLNIDPVTGEPIVQQGQMPMSPQASPMLAPIPQKLTTAQMEEIDAANASATAAIPQNIAALQAAGIPLVGAGPQSTQQANQSGNPFAFLSKGQSQQQDNGIDLYKQSQQLQQSATPSGQASSIERPTLQTAQPQAPTGPMFIPVQSRQQTDTNQTTTQGLTAQSKKDLESANTLMTSAMERQGALESEKTKQQGLDKQELARIEGEQLTAEKLARDAQRQKEIEAQKQLDASAQDMLNYEFDQNRVWKRATTGGSIAAGIGIALGALAQGFGAKSNAALDAIDKQINRDIEQQRMEYEKIKDKTRAQDSAYGRLRQLGMDDSQARTQLQKATYSQIQNKLEAGLTQKFGPEEAKIKADMAMATQNMRLAEATKEQQSKVKGSTVTKQTEMKQVSGGGGKGITGYDNKPLSGEMAKQVGFMDGFLSDLGLMKNAIKKGDTRYKFGKDNEFTRAQTRAAENLGRLQSGGAVTEGEMKIFEGILKGFWDNPQESLQRLQEQENIIMGRRNAITPTPFSSYHGNTGTGRPVE